jgi:hypothetical protein
MIKSIQHTAIQGLARSQHGVARAADEIARFPIKGKQGDLNRSLLELRQQEQAAKANVQSLKTGNETLGTLLDELA